MLLCGLFPFFLFTCVYAKYNIFENGTIELRYNEIAFFETPGYPILHNSSDFFTKNVTFFTTESSANGTRCVFVLQALTWYFSPFKNNDDIFVFNISSFYLETYHYNLQFFNAYQGYVYFEEWDDSCPFEAFSRDVPFKFEDETQIIFIASIYENKTNLMNIPPPTPSRTQSCKWQFIAPEGYGLKIVIQTFDISSSTKFRMHNSTTLLLNERSAKSNRPYYIADNYTQIYLSKDNNTLSQKLEFAAYITILKKTDTKVDGNCVVTHGVGNYSWASNSNLTLGYQNNIYCNNEVKVKSNTTILATVEQCSLEQYVDLLTYHDDQYSFVLNLKDEMVLRPYMNESDKIYYFQFITDGSYVASGFKINFVENACHCGAPDIRCDNRTYTVMGDTTYVCPKLECHFKILPCHTLYSSLTITLSAYTDLDFIKVLSNDVMVYNSAAVSLNSNGAQNVYLNSLNNNTIIVSSISRSRKSTTFSLAPFELPQATVHTILAENDPNFVLDASVSTFVVVEIDESLALRNATIVVYGRNDLECKNSFFNNESLTEMIFFQTCKKSAAFYKCVSNVKEMVYYHDGLIVNCFIAISLSTHTRNCLYPSTVYFVQGDISVVSVLSTENGECKATILKEFDKLYVLSDLFTTAKDDNTEIWFGMNQKTKFLEFNKKTASKWKNIMMTSEVYSLKVPRDSILQLTLIAVKLPFLNQITSAPFYSLLSSTHYGWKKCFSFDSQSFVSYQMTNATIKFTVLELQPNDESYFFTANKTIRINHIGEVFIFKNEYVSLFFATTAQTYCGCYLVAETVKDSLEIF